MSIIQRIPGTNLMPLNGMTSQIQTHTLVSESGTPVSLFQECLGALPVFGDLTSDDPLQNDFNSFIEYQRPLSFVLFYLLDGNCNEIALLANDTYGTYFPVGFLPASGGYTFFQEDYTGFKVDWKKVLQIQGHGLYQIKKKVIVGLEVVEEIKSCLFDLCQFTTERADETVTIKTLQNGYIIGQGLDYTGVNWEQQIRIPGFFGNKQRKFIQNEFLNKNRRLTQIQDTLIHDFILEPLLWPGCLRGFIDEMLLANNILISDYNVDNTDNLKEINVRPLSIDTEYFAKSPKAADEIKFEERIQNRVKRNVR